MLAVYKLIRSFLTTYKVTTVFFILSLVFLGSNNTVSAQIVWLGAKVAGTLNQPKLTDNNFKDTARTIPSPGFSAGAALLFKVKNRYFLHTEYLYSLRSKINTGKVDHELIDRTVFQYLEVPILFTIQSKIQVGKEKNFKWYVGAGPNISYLLSGKGVIKSSELQENNISSQSYTIKFGHRGPNRDRKDQVFYNNVNRFQFGLNFGAGILLEPRPKHKIIVDLRYTVDQTLLGKQSADYLVPDDYSDNLKIRNRGIKFSLIYMFEYNLNKKERHRGKSTLKPNRK